MEDLNAVDQHVGARLRLKRGMDGVSQVQLGKELGVSFQQIQKYESGQNRLAASKLYFLAKRFKVTTDYFFQGYEARPEHPDSPDPREVAEFMYTAKGVALNKAAQDIEKPEDLKLLTELAHRLAVKA